MENELIRWLEADRLISTIKQQRAELEQRLCEAEKEAESAAEAIKHEMVLGGEYEVLVSGEYADYKIHYTKPRGSVKIEDVDAVPDEFCKIERKPKLKEIREHLDSTNVNWAYIEVGEPNLTYKIIKKV